MSKATRSPAHREAVRRRNELQALANQYALAERMARGLPPPVASQHQARSSSEQVFMLHSALAMATRVVAETKNSRS